MFYIGKTQIKFDFTFFAVIALLIFVDSSGTATLSLIASLIHETAHLIAMLICGSDLQRVVFYGGGICIISDINKLCFNKRLVILSAGCFTNALISIIGFVFFYDDTVFVIFSMVNTIICFFNLIPIGYFDGAEILDTILSRYLSFEKTVLLKRIIGILFSIILVLAIAGYCFIYKGEVSVSFLFVILYLIMAQFVS
ncbi:MAG: peptidase M50 [Ruminococcaceae bacterium]|nr:peptidase M50 [Oscillospiraceae bacterium]